MGEQTFLAFTLVADQVIEEVNESLTLQLATTPATLQTIPMGEGVFFKQEIPLIVMDTERELRQCGISALLCRVVEAKNFLKCLCYTVAILKLRA